MRRLVLLGVVLLAIAAGVARGGGPAAPIPLPCGLPQAPPLWVDYADGMVPFWSTIFARPGIVGAASNFLIPPQLRAKGARTVYFDLYLSNRVGTPSNPADPATITSRADKLFDTAVTSSGCDHPLMAENELFGSQLPTPWTPTTVQYRANVLAFLQRLAERGARPFLLLSSNPYTHDATADDWWRQAAQVADLVPEIYFSGPVISRLGAEPGSRRLRATMRNRLENLIEIGVPTNRLGMMLTFSSTPKAGGREGLRPLSKWLDVVKWEAIAAKQVAAELHVASVWSWGWAAFNPLGNDPDKPKAACTWLWTRNHSLCDAPALAGKELDQSLSVGTGLPAGALCVLDRTRLLESDVAALARLTGDRDLAYSAEFQHAVLTQGRPVDAARVLQAERDVILDRFRGSRSAYLAALARAKATPALARSILADELRRRSVQAALRVPAPSARELQDWYDTYAGAAARLVRSSLTVPWLGNSKSGLALAHAAPGRLFTLHPGQSVTIDGVKVTVLGEAAPLGSFPLAQAARSVRRALLDQERSGAFATWVRRRQNQSLGRLSCLRDQRPQPDSVDLTDWLPFLSLG
ncbi:MAG: hypothetical protein QOE38_2036 [Thermoleophilaceae bacterium]|nr:hypothetical protein [Thermoleophilaceae bacterium]